MGFFNLQLMLLRSDMRPAGIEVMLGTLAAEHWTRPTSRSGNSFRQRLLTLCPVSRVQAQAIHCTPAIRLSYARNAWQ